MAEVKPTERRPAIVLWVDTDVVDSDVKSATAATSVSLVPERRLECAGNMLLFRVAMHQRRWAARSVHLGLVKSTPTAGSVSVIDVPLRATLPSTVEDTHQSRWNVYDARSNTPLVSYDPSASIMRMDVTLQERTYLDSLLLYVYNGPSLTPIYNGVLPVVVAKRISLEYAVEDAVHVAQALAIASDTDRTKTTGWAAPSARTWSSPTTLSMDRVRVWLPTRELW